MLDLKRVRMRWGSNPHFINVDLDGNEIGYLLLSGSGEIVRAVVNDEDNVEHGMFVSEIRRLAEPIAGAAAASATR